MVVISTISRDLMAVKTKIPKSLSSIRAYLAVHRIRQVAIARAYGCCSQWISALVNEERKASADVVERLREAIREVQGS